MKEIMFIGVMLSVLIIIGIFVMKFIIRCDKPKDSTKIKPKSKKK